MELAVFRLVQESLTNIHRHSGSKRATIEISRTPEQVLLEVRDEGKGISRESQRTFNRGEPASESGACANAPANSTAK